MSKNSVSRGSTNGAVASEVKFAGNDKEKMYEPKHRRKLIRVLTVIAYLFSVSLAAIMLSLFYVFIYNPGKISGGNDRDQHFQQSTAQNKFSQDSLDLMNDTYLNLEREEPRALPVRGTSHPFLSWFMDYEGHYNHSLSSGMENSTVFNKIINSLQRD